MNADLADRARQVARRYAPRTQERRTAAALYSALSTTRTPASASRALNTFTDPATAVAARELLDQLERETTR